MLFNSLTFALFLPTVFVLYWTLFHRSLRLQNLFLLVASYVFYGWWDWRFLFLIFISSLADFLIGVSLDKHESKRTRRALLSASIIVNLGLLGFFKYFDFFITSFADLLTLLGLNVHIETLRIILPVGISFYTFQTLSYTIDIYKRKIKSTSDPIEFFAFVSFFPQLVAGPIERAASLLPQFSNPRRFSGIQAADGLRQMLWGFVMKMVIADNMAPRVDQIFANYQNLGSIDLVVGAFLFAIQIYGDFAGYSNIAIGTAKLFGFELMRNFAYPYFSRNIAEFWQRWHISLSTWFRDYLYIPLGGSRTSKAKHLRNILITFTVSGLWHGANWTFVAWGFLNGLYYLPFVFRSPRRKPADPALHHRFLPRASEALAILGTFILTLLAWVFFRAPSISVALAYLGRIFVSPYTSHLWSEYSQALLLAAAFLSFEWLQRNKAYALEINEWARPVRWLAYMSTIFIILVLGNFGEKAFIYFQF